MTIPLVENTPIKKTMKKREANITPDVLAYLMKTRTRSFALEVKMKGNKLLPHQEKCLEDVERGRFSHKIPDLGSRNPFDAFGLINADSIVAVCDGRNCEFNVRGFTSVNKFKAKIPPRDKLK